MDKLNYQRNNKNCEEVDEMLTKIGSLDIKDEDKIEMNKLMCVMSSKINSNEIENFNLKKKVQKLETENRDQQLQLEFYGYYTALGILRANIEIKSRVVCGGRDYPPSWFHDLLTQWIQGRPTPGCQVAAVGEVGEYLLWKFEQYYRGIFRTTGNRNAQIQLKKYAQVWLYGVIFSTDICAVNVRKHLKEPKDTGNLRKLENYFKGVKNFCDNIQVLYGCTNSGIHSPVAKMDVQKVAELIAESNIPESLKEPMQAILYA